jgi:hypothetical protein
MKPRYATYYRSLATLGGSGSGIAEAERQIPGRIIPEPASRSPSVLEAQHPDIVEAITLLWGYPEMNAYFQKLWLDDGSGTPIAPEAMSDLMLLAGVHRWLTPERPVRNMASIYDASSTPPRPKDIWDSVPRRR